MASIFKLPHNMNVEDHDEESTVLIGVQLADVGEFERNAKENPCQQPEKVRRAPSPDADEAQRQLELNDEFEEQEVGDGIVFS
jgi:hypothetical protein